MRTIKIVQSQPIREETPGGRVFFIGDMDIDCDGSGGNPDRDRYFKPDTTLHRNGKALNAYKEKFIVVPPCVVMGVRPVVMGAKARATYKGRSVDAVVGDSGPTHKVGEASVALAEALGIPFNPNTGGIDAFEVLYEIWPGVPAVVDGITYQLQPR